MAGSGLERGVRQRLLVPGSKAASDEVSQRWLLSAGGAACSKRGVGGWADEFFTRNRFSDLNTSVPSGFSW